jgi:hypothetical protein
MTPLIRRLAQHESYPLFAGCKQWVVGLCWELLDGYQDRGEHLWLKRLPTFCWRSFARGT